MPNQKTADVDSRNYFSLSLNIKMQVPVFSSWEIVPGDHIVDGEAASGVPPVQGSLLS